MLRNGTGSLSPAPAPAQCTKADCGQSICGNRHLGSTVSWKQNCVCLSFGGHREPHQFPGGGFSEKRRSSVLCQDSEFCWQHISLLLGLVCMSSQGGIASASWAQWTGGSVQGGPFLGPGYMASGPGGSLKSLAADTQLAAGSSSVMPALKASVGQRRHWPRVLKPASEWHWHTWADQWKPANPTRIYVARREGLPADFCGVHHLGSRKTKKAISSRFDQCHRRASFLLCLRGELGRNVILILHYQKGVTILHEMSKHQEFFLGFSRWNKLQESVWGPRKYLELDLTAIKCGSLQTITIYVSGSLFCGGHTL